MMMNNTNSNAQIFKQLERIMLFTMLIIALIL